MAKASSGYSVALDMSDISHVMGIVIVGVRDLARDYDASVPEFHTLPFSIGGGHD